MSKNPKTLTFAKTLTFGCRLNIYESQVIEEKANAAGLKDVLIVNSCAVTNEAVRQTRQGIRKAKRANPEQKIIVTGCAAQTQASDFAKMAEVDLVIGNAEKLQDETYQKLTFGINLNDKIQVNDIMSIKETASHLVEGMDGHARAFVQVQNGCDHRCTFCIIPYGRGPSRSTPMGAVVEQIKKLVDNGFNEIVLTGVDITSYGADLPKNSSLGKLVQAILSHVPNLPRLRISSIDSIEADEALFETIKSEKRLMPHLHLSLQSGDDMILKRMKRRHLRQDTLDFVHKVRSLRPNMIFGADIIAGFPTETEEMFENSLKIVREANLTYLHVFPYSAREGTPAAKIPNQIIKSIKKQRAAKLRELGQEQYQKLLASKIDKDENILIEHQNDEYWIGRSEQFIPIKILSNSPFSHKEQNDISGKIINVKITSKNDKVLFAKMRGDINE
jgi:threonylcarbamoyladenosine tRNA methylthiotransferase MtaB